MSNDMRLVKLGMMISDIFDDLGGKGLYGDLDIFDTGGYESSWLSVIYDYDKLNDYGKAIIDQVSNPDVLEYDGGWDMDKSMQMKAAKGVVKALNERTITNGKKYIPGRIYENIQDKSLKLHFLFWALMVLAVDDTDKEEYLSMICAYAKSLSVSDDEMMDLVRIIRVLYNVEGDNEIQTDSVASEFEKVIRKYGIAKADGVGGNAVDKAMAYSLSAGGVPKETADAISDIMNPFRKRFRV